MQRKSDKVANECDGSGRLTKDQHIALNQSAVKNFKTVSGIRGVVEVPHL